MCEGHPLSLDQLEVTGIQRVVVVIRPLVAGVGLPSSMLDRMAGRLHCP